MYNFANKVVEWRAKNGFVDSLTTAGQASTDRPQVNVNQCKKESMRKCHNQHWASKTAKMTNGVYEM